jgi:S1-C subfamily serine protease
MRSVFSLCHCIIEFVKRPTSLLLGAGVVLFLLPGCLHTGTATATTAAAPADSLINESEIIRRALVRINVTSQTPDRRTPWNPGRRGQGHGSGFIIDGQRIMTNAHVVSNTRFILLDKDGDPKRYPARVEHVAHDCDLAILKVDDPSFFDGTAALTIGHLPEMHSTVYAYGYPIGGERMSVTRGVVSRIEFRTYSHSGLDSHLSIQIDAAINPGNSGGPVVQNGKIVGVAFQGYSGMIAQNTGYMIPTPVVRRFLADIEDGAYEGYAELAVDHMNLLNPSYRQYLGMDDSMSGVVVSGVLEAGCAHGVIEEGDVLMKIGGHSIDNNGHIIVEDEYVQLEEVIERKFHGDKVRFEILRDRKVQEVEVTLKGAWPHLIFRNAYDRLPRFVLFGGLLFQPLSRDFIGAHKVSDPGLKYFYDFYVIDGIYIERPEVVILSSILADPINTYMGGFVMSIIDEINGKKILRLEDVAAAFSESADQYVIRTVADGLPIVIDADKVAAARERILERYQVTREQRLKREW